MGASSSVPEGETAAECLKKQNAGTSAAIINLLKDDADFAKLAKFEGESIVARDNEDAAKLQSGVNASIEKGVLAKLDPPPEYQVIDVLGKSPDDARDGADEGRKEGRKDGFFSSTRLRTSSV